VLGEQRWLAGDRMTEADICLFTTLIRFDLVYHTHFKCNRKRIIDYPNLWGFVREIYQLPGVAKTCNFEHIRRHYYGSHESINPHRIVAIGPKLELERPHGRERLGGMAARDLII
jgi:putative glutathione S-transferase